MSDFVGRNHFEMYPSDARAIFEEVVRTKTLRQAVARPFVFPDHPEWGVTYWDWTLVPVLGDRGDVDFLVFSLQDVTARTRLEEEILHAHVSEQQRIGQELHDGLGQELTGLGYLAKILQQKLRNKGLKEAETAAELARGIPHALGQVQSIVKGLVPLEIGAEDLVPALRALTTSLEEQTGIACRVEADPEAEIGTTRWRSNSIASPKRRSPTPSNMPGRNK